MNKFKVGASVEVISNRFHVKEGAKGTVMATKSDRTQVFFTSGVFWAELNAKINGLWVMTDALKLAEPRYSESFTKPAKAESPQGHTSDGSGLQNHSLGGSYPWGIVAYVDKRYGMKFTVENLQTGAVLSHDSYPRQWGSARLANEYLKRFLLGAAGTQRHTIKRTAFNWFGNLSFDVEEEQPITVYYRALEQDIG